MVRNYTRKSNRQSWLEDDMKVAVLAMVERTMTYDAASICYEVPRSTLQDRVKKVKEGKLNVQQCGLKGKIFTISPEIILPIPKAQNINRSSRRRGKTAIITESPYKKELQEAKENSKPLPKKKQKKNNIKKRLFTSTDKEEIHPKKLCVSTDDDDSADEECIYCSMPYKEDSKGEKWVKCINCCRWCHELCGGVDNWKTYICDLCIKKNK